MSEFYYPSYPAYDTFEQQPQPFVSNQNYTQPVLTQPQQNIQHLYCSKKSKLVNEIINSINNQNKKLLQTVTISQKRITHFKYYHQYILKKCNLMNELEEKYKKRCFDLEKEVNNKFKTLEELDKRIHSMKTWQEVYQKQQNQLEDLIKFLYKYLNGKKKKNNLKKAMYKIIGHEYCDLRKYNLTEPTPLTDIFIAREELVSNSYESKDTETIDKQLDLSSNLINKNKEPLKTTTKIIKLITSPTGSDNKPSNKLINSIKSSEIINIPTADTNINNLNNIINNDLELKENSLIETETIESITSFSSIDLIKAPTVDENIKLKHKKIKIKSKSSHLNKLPTAGDKNKIIQKNKKNKFIKKIKKKNNKQRRNNNKKIKKNNKKNKIKFINNPIKPPNPTEPPDPWDLDPSDPFWQEQLELYGYKETYEMGKDHWKNIKRFFEGMRYDPEFEFADRF